MDTSARQRGFEIRVFPLLGELPKVIKPHLPICQLYRWQLCPNMWSSPTTKSFDPIVVTALRVGFPGESHGPTSCGFACNCPVDPVAWTTEASGPGPGWSLCSRVSLHYHFDVSSFLLLSVVYYFHSPTNWD